MESWWGGDVAQEETISFKTNKTKNKQTLHWQKAPANSAWANMQSDTDTGSYPS